MPDLKDKQLIDGVCQFCGRNGRPDEEDSDLEDGWLVLSDVTAQLWGIYGEWCSTDCFWNDFLRQAEVEMAEECEKRPRPCIEHKIN